MLRSGRMLGLGFITALLLAVALGVGCGEGESNESTLSVASVSGDVCEWLCGVNAGSCDTSCKLYVWLDEMRMLCLEGCEITYDKCNDTCR